MVYSLLPLMGRHPLLLPGQLECPFVRRHTAAPLCPGTALNSSAATAEDIAFVRSLVSLHLPLDYHPGALQLYVLKPILAFSTPRGQRRRLRTHLMTGTMSLWEHWNVVVEVICGVFSLLLIGCLKRRRKGIHSVPALTGSVAQQMEKTLYLVWNYIHDEVTSDPILKYLSVCLRVHSEFISVWVCVCVYVNFSGILNMWVCVCVCVCVCVTLSAHFE